MICQHDPSRLSLVPLQTCHFRALTTAFAIPSGIPNLFPGTINIQSGSSPSTPHHRSPPVVLVWLACLHVHLHCANQSPPTPRKPLHNSPLQFSCLDVHVGCRLSLIRELLAGENLDSASNTGSKVVRRRRRPMLCSMHSGKASPKQCSAKWIAKQTG